VIPSQEIADEAVKMALPMLGDNSPESRL